MFDTLKARATTVVIVRKSPTPEKGQVPPHTHLATADDAADLQPGPVLRALLHSTARNQHLLARRCRLRLRQAGYHVTVAWLDLGRVEEAAGHFDELVRAATVGDFPRALAAQELLRLAFGVAVMPLESRAKAERGAR